jgi:hypothetical protein
MAFKSGKSRKTLRAKRADSEHFSVRFLFIDLYKY